MTIKPALRKEAPEHESLEETHPTEDEKFH